MQNHNNPYKVDREDAPKVEDTVSQQMTNEVELSVRISRETSVPPIHVDRPRDREKEDDGIVTELPRNVHNREMAEFVGWKVHASVILVVIQGEGCRLATSDSILPDPRGSLQE